MMTDEFMSKVHLRHLADSILKTENAYKALWDVVKPKPNQVWTKRPCPNGKCSIGWSFGVGTYKIRDDNNDYGQPHHLVCGCLYREINDDS